MDQYTRRVSYGEGVGAEEVRKVMKPGFISLVKSAIPSAVLPSLGVFKIMHYFTHPFFKNGDFALQNVPYNYPVYFKICMNKFIPRACNEFPRHIRIVFFQGNGEMLGRLTNNLN